jgi:hypothetical protein
MLQKWYLFSSRVVNIKIKQAKLVNWENKYDLQSNHVKCPYFDKLCMVSPNWWRSLHVYAGCSNIHGKLWYILRKYKELHLVHSLKIIFMITYCNIWKAERSLLSLYLISAFF